MDPFGDSEQAGMNGEEAEFAEFDAAAQAGGDPDFEDEAIMVSEDHQQHHGDYAEPVTVSPGEDVMSAILGSGARGPSMDNLSVRSVSPMPSIPREEPETIKFWRMKQKEMLEEKDAKEAVMMKELKEKAKKELQDWYKKYEEQLSKTKGDNRKEEKTFVAEMDEITPGTEWDRVHKLCDFNAKNTRNSKDLSRMRSILLQLKQNPKPVLSVN